MFTSKKVISSMSYRERKTDPVNGNFEVNAKRLSLS